MNTLKPEYVVITNDEMEEFDNKETYNPNIMKIIKFGGTSLQTPTLVNNAIEIIKSYIIILHKFSFYFYFW